MIMLRRIIAKGIFFLAIVGCGFFLTVAEVDDGSRPVFVVLSTDSEDYFPEFSQMDRTYEGPLPWVNDKKFLAAIEKLGNPRVLAAYRATLTDPLPGEDYNIGLAARRVAGTVVLPGKVYSQNRTIGPYTKERGYRPGPTYKGTSMITTVGGGVCKIASVTYNIATFCSFDIVQRYAHGMTVPYVPPGQDATVYYGVKDFQFRNNTGYPILLWAEKVNNDLYMAAYGFAPLSKITWHHKVLKRFGFPKKYRSNPKLGPGEEKVVHKGAEGYLVKSWVIIEKEDGSVTQKNKGMSYYSPFPEIVERAPRARR